MAEVCNLFVWIELGEVPEVVFTDKVVLGTLHKGDVEPMSSKEVL